MATFDLVVVGAGIVGLAHALAAARRGLRVAVLERDACATSASVRNFGFVTVSGQDGGATRRRALRSREIWAEVAREAVIPIHQQGAVIVAQRLPALSALEEFASGEMGKGCELWDAPTLRSRLPRVNPKALGALWSPHELRVEARDAIPLLARWLEDKLGVVFSWNTIALGFDGTTVAHSAGKLSAGAVVIAPGASVSTFAPDLARRVDVRQCKLQMMRLANPGFTLPGVVMTDLSLARYEGFAVQPSAVRLKDELQRECAAQLAAGVHLIVAQSRDGTLVVGDSHHYADHADPFTSSAVDALILDEFRALFGIEPPAVVERWAGYYPVADVRPVLDETLAPRVRLVSVTSGTGMSTAFAIGEEAIGQLFGAS
jgi:FAD dependent oxidoreductase TIGR03364